MPPSSGQCLFYPEDESSRLSQDVVTYLPVYTRPKPAERYYSLLVWIRREREVQTLILRRRREELYVPCHGKPGQNYSNLDTPWAGHFYYVHQDLKRRKHFSVYHTTGITGLPAMLSVTGPPQSSSKSNLIIMCITKQVTEFCGIAIENRSL